MRLSPRPPLGASTLSEDSSTLHLISFDRSYNEIAVKGIRNEIKRVSVLGSGRELDHRKLGGAPWAHLPGVLWIEVAESELNPDATILKVELEGPLDLYTDAGDVVMMNVSGADAVARRKGTV